MEDNLLEKPYDCTEDVREHKARVELYMRAFARRIVRRAKCHDDSKLADPIEKQMFDTWVPNLKKAKFGSDEYKAALEGMGEGLKLHYAANTHHPECHAAGVDDMTLIDVLEMACDWMAAAEAKDDFVNFEYLAKRFGISKQLMDIIVNTFFEGV